MFALKPTSSASLVKKIESVKHDRRGRTGRRGTLETTITRLTHLAGDVTPDPNHRRPANTYPLLSIAAPEPRPRAAYTQRGATASPPDRGP